MFGVYASVLQGGRVGRGAGRDAIENVVELFLVLGLPGDLLMNRLERLALQARILRQCLQRWLRSDFRI